VLEKIGNRTVLEEVLHRCKHIPGADIVVCAIPDASRDDRLAVLVERARCTIVRGSESDVLARYAKAAKVVRAAVILRITADCPLLDPEVCGAVLSLRAREGADYASNGLELSFPKGLDSEAFTAAALAEAAAKANSAYDREHVTPWLIRAPHIKRVNLFSGDPRLARLRWTLDYPEDLTFLRAVFAKLPPDARTMSEVLAVIEREPAIMGINALRNSYLQDLREIAGFSSSKPVAS
jgi:glutamate-1-semialdehyde 2,1-aminomutase/spore coat polysaccharide biosynthesis protein SpsF